MEKCIDIGGQAGHHEWCGLGNDGKVLRLLVRVKVGGGALVLSIAPGLGHLHSAMQL